MSTEGHYFCFDLSKGPDFLLLQVGQGLRLNMAASSSSNLLEVAGSSAMPSVPKINIYRLVHSD